MLEWYEKYNSFERKPTASSFDKPMIIFLGLSIPDFMLGVATFLTIIMAWDSFAAIAVAIGSATLATYLSKLYRRKCPPKFLHHLGWALGFQKIDTVPAIFKKYKRPTFGP